VRLFCKEIMVQASQIRYDEFVGRDVWPGGDVYMFLHMSKNPNGRVRSVE
jgi:hypothetical protein